MNWFLISQKTFFIVSYVKFYIELTGWTLWRRRDVSPMRYELAFNIPEDYILHSHRLENLHLT
jgi:hypothetical protein